MALGGAFFQDAGAGSKACDLGRIHSNGHQAKPAREVRVGDMLQVKNEGGEFQIEVLQLSEMRGPAAVAQTLYRETEASKDGAVPRRRKSARRCRSSRRCPSAGHQSATGAGSSSFAAER